MPTKRWRIVVKALRGITRELGAPLVKMNGRVTPHGMHTYEPVYFLAGRCKDRWDLDPADVELIPMRDYEEI